MAWAGGKEHQEYIQVDWYPLFTDSVGWNIYTGGVGLGWVDATGGDVHNKMGSSLEVQWLNVIGAKYNTGHGQRISMGVGIDWKNYKLKTSERFMQPEGSEGVAIGSYPDGATSRSSRLRTFSLTMPVIFRQRVGSRLDVVAGVVPCLNVHASLATKYKTASGDEVKENVSKHLHQAPVTVDLMAALSYRHVGIYLKFSPCRVIKKDWGPKLTSLQAGIILGL